MMTPILSARWVDRQDYDEATGFYTGLVVLEFGGHLVAQWRAPEPYHKTNEEYAAEFVAGKLAELFAKLEAA